MPSGDVPAPRPGAPWLLIGLIVVIGAVRAVAAGVLPLTEDEAYYRLWAQAPALGYYDHPPMIAWWIWTGVRLVGDSPLGVRLLPVLATAATSLLVFDMAGLAGGTAAEARRAGVWHNAMLLVAAGGFLAVPDAPAALFWALSLWATLRARRGGGGGGGFGWWLAAGFAAGLATLSKYSALFLGPGVLLWLLSSAGGRATLRRPGPWLAVAAAAALFSLNVAWNQAHDWVTFAKQFGRIAPRGFAPRYFLEFVLTEALLVNPIIALFLGRLLFARSLARATVAPFLLTSLPFVAYLAVHSLHDRIQAHWPAPVYPALAICAAFAATTVSRPWRRLAGAAAPFALAICVVAGAWVALPMTGTPLRLDPAGPIRGWPTFAGRIEALRRGTGAAWVGTASYGADAQLADQRVIAAPIVQISERARWRDLVEGAWADTARPGLIVDLPRRINAGQLGRCFTQVRPLGQIVRGAPGEAGKAYAAFLVTGPTRDVLGAGCGLDAASEPSGGYRRR